jgi:hypothetical protein
VVQDLKKNFEEAGFKPQVKQLVDFQDAYGLEGEEDEADDDEEWQRDGRVVY